MKSKRAVLVEPGRFELTEVEVVPRSNEVAIKVEVCGLCNWELNHWKGLLGKCPMSLGHEWAGTVVEVGSDVKGVKPGDRITGLPGIRSGFSEYAIIDGRNCYKLVDNVDLREALGEPLKCIITVLRAAAPETGDYGVVLGCGPMGLWCIQGLAGKLLSALIAVDIDDDKLELAKKFGATHTINAKETNAAEAIAAITGNHMADFVIEGTGVPSLLNDAVRYLRRTGRGRLVLMSSHEEACRNFDFRETISRSVEIRVAHPGYSINHEDDMRRAVLNLNNGVFRMDGIITHRFSLDEIQKAFETLENKPKGYIKGVVIPWL